MGLRWRERVLLTLSGHSGARPAPGKLKWAAA